MNNNNNSHNNNTTYCCYKLIGNRNNAIYEQIFKTYEEAIVQGMYLEDNEWTTYIKELPLGGKNE